MGNEQLYDLCPRLMQDVCSSIIQTQDNVGTLETQSFAYSGWENKEQRIQTVPTQWQPIFPPSVVQKSAWGS